MALSTANAAAAEAAAVRPCWLAKILLPSGTIAICGNDFALDYDGTTYAANGRLIAVAGLRAGVDLKFAPVQFQLNADSALITAIRGQNIQFRIVELYIALLNVTTGRLDYDPELVDKYFISHSTLGAASGVRTLTLHCESKGILVRRRFPIPLSDTNQQRRHPGDTGLHMVPRIPDMELPWGGRMNRVSHGGPGAVGFGQQYITLPRRRSDGTFDT